jgi:carboxyl-terminal processing protease
LTIQGKPKRRNGLGPEEQQMSHSSKYLLISLGAILLVIVAFAMGYVFGALLPATTDRNLAAINEAYRNIVRDYVDPGKIDRDALSEAAIKAMIDELGDPYSAYLNPDMYEQQTADEAGVYGGIGAEVGIKNGRVTIVSTFEGSPATLAGIQAGDVLLEIDGVSAEGMSVWDAVLRVRGLKGTGVRLLIERESEVQPLSFDIIRGEILTSSVEYEMLGGIAYISLDQFGDRSDSELEEVLIIANREAEGIILDLRGNPGGGLNTVINITSRFIDTGIVLSVRYSDGKTEIHRVVDREVTTDLPIVVLVDGFSASASEVLAGALQDHERAIIAGQTTYGKGSVNYMEPLPDGSAIYITAARWLTPDGHLIEGEGVTPDFILDVDDDWVAWAVSFLHSEAEGSR